MSNNNSIQEIMLRYLNGESSHEETKTLQEWIADSEANEEEFEVVKNLWSDSAKAALISVDTEKAWQVVHARTMEKQNKVVSLFSWKKTFAIAASILLIVGAIYLFYYAPHTGWKVTVAKNNNEIIHLSDGSTITLRKGSRIALSRNPRAFRKAKLEGIAYFEIKHNPQNPFTVVTTNGIIKDIGTAFLIKSYDSLEQVTVLEGEVSFANKKEEAKAILLQAGESAVLKNNEPQRKKVDTANALSWRSDVLIFNHTPLPQVATDLKNYYEIEIKLSGNLDSARITAEFRNESLEQVVKELKLITGLKFMMKENTLYISK